MSDDLIKRLRDAGDHARFEPHMYHEAADRIAALEAEVAIHKAHILRLLAARPAPEPVDPADPVAEAARVLLDDLNIALGTKAPAQGREQWTYARKWTNASDAASAAPTMMDRPTPIQMIRAALRAIGEASHAQLDLDAMGFRQPGQYRLTLWTQYRRWLWNGLKSGSFAAVFMGGVLVGMWVYVWVAA